jgi:hypothetical protein
MALSFLIKDAFISVSSHAVEARKAEALAMVEMV